MAGVVHCCGDGGSGMLRPWGMARCQWLHWALF